MSWASVFVLRSIMPDRARHRRRVERVRLQELRPDQDGAERRAQLVRDHGDELVLGAVGRLRLRARGRLRAQGLVARPGPPRLRVDAGGQLARGNRLEQVLVGVGGQAVGGAVRARAGGHHDDGDAAGSRIRAQGANQVGADGHVGHDHVRRGGKGGRQGGGRIGRPRRPHGCAASARYVRARRSASARRRGRAADGATPAARRGCGPARETRRARDWARASGPHRGPHADHG